MYEDFEQLNGLDEGYAEWRMKICLDCPIYSSKNGGICNSKLWLNPDTGDVSTRAREGYYRGCNCKLSNKTKSKNSQCPAGKW